MARIALACRAVRSFLACAGDQLGQQPLEPVHGLDPEPGELLAAIAQHPQRFELTIGTQHPQGLGADRDDRDGVGVAGIGLAVVAGVEEPDPGGELGRHVHDMLAGLEQTLRQRAAGAVGSLDRPDPVGPGLHVGPHRGVAGLVGANRPEPSSFSCWSTTSMVADSLWGSTPMITFAIAFSCLSSYR